MKCMHGLVKGHASSALTVTLKGDSLGETCGRYEKVLLSVLTPKRNLSVTLVMSRLLSVVTWRNIRAFTLYINPMNVTNVMPSFHEIVI